MKNVCKVPVKLILKILFHLCTCYVRWYYDAIKFPEWDKAEEEWNKFMKEENEDELLSSIDSD